MKKLSAFLILSALSPVIFAQTASRLTGHVRYKGNVTELIPTDSTRLSYSGARGGTTVQDNKADSVIAFQYNTVTPNRFGRVAGTYNTYDQNDNKTIADRYSFQNSTPTGRDSFVYNMAGQMNFYYTLVWNTSANAYKNYIRTTYTYSGSQVVEANTEIFYPSKNKWQDYAREDYVHDSKQRLVLKMMHGWDHNMQKNYTIKYTYTYDNQDNLTEIFRQDSTSGGWWNTSRERFIYDAANVLVEDSFYNHTTSWQFVRNDSFFYTNKLLTKKLIFENGNLARQRFHYNTFNQITSLVKEFYTNNQWNYGTDYYTSDSFYYETYTKPVANVPGPEELHDINIYPNPAPGGMVHIALPTDPAGSYTLEIYNLQGAKLRQQILTRQMNNIYTGDLEAGIYLFKLNDGQKSSASQVIIR